MATKKTTTATTEATAETVNLSNTVTTTTLKATATKTMADYHRMDYAGRRVRLYGGLKSEAVDGGSIVLPTSDAENFDKFFCVDSGEVYIFYEGVWYKQSS